MYERLKLNIMQDKKEELIKIFVKCLNKVFAMGLKQSPFDGDNSEFYGPLIELDIAPNLYNEVEALINSLPNGEASRVSKNEGEKRICPVCLGDGEIVVDYEYGEVDKCHRCSGTGQI